MQCLAPAVCVAPPTVHVAIHAQPHLLTLPVHWWRALCKVLLCVFCTPPSTSKACRGGLSLDESYLLGGSDDGDCKN